MRRTKNLVLLTGLLLLAQTGEAAAYIGPGAGLTAIGTVLAVIGAVLLAVIGFLWYPIKRLRAKMKKTSANGAGNEPGQDGNAAQSPEATKAPAETSAAPEEEKPSS